MNDKGLHIIAFDVPFPADYGGVIDIFYKIKALHANNLSIILHCFIYGDKLPSSELEKYCVKIHYYKRNRYKNPFFGELPYIVQTRNSPEILTNLQVNQWPILFEGLHTTYFLMHPDLSKRQKIVRTHNIEHLYYKGLFESETSFFKRYFFETEAAKLEKYEVILNTADLIFAISKSDATYFARDYKNVHLVPAFHSNEEVSSTEGKGKHILYHGNLSVAENNKAALHLVEHVFSKITFPCLIVGNNPSSALKNSVKKWPHIQLIANVSSNQVLNYIQEAHINILYTFQATGIKLKLLNSLFLGKHCVVNSPMIQNTGLESYTNLVNETNEITKIKQLWETPFTNADLTLRKNLNHSEFSNFKNTQILIDQIKQKKEKVTTIFK